MSRSAGGNVRMSVLIMAGGTGGHVYPALAVAEALRARGTEIAWLGVHKGLEATVVPRAGIPLHFLRVGGLRGKGVARWLSSMWLLLPLLQSMRLINRLKPHAVLGMGGFVAGPGGLAAWLMRKPLLIHEQNAVPGLTNRVLARFARRVMEAFPGAFAPRIGAVHTGNPVRSEIAAMPAPETRGVGRRARVRLLVLGGSQGARVLNERVPAALGVLPDPGVFEVWHQTGTRNLGDAEACYRAARLDVTPVAYIEDMAAAYGWADLVVCRSGAMTVSELAAAGIAAILVPFPHAVADEQTLNARYLANVGAALLVAERDFSVKRLSTLLLELAGARERLLEMARAARQRALPDATERVAAACLEVAHV